MFDVHRPQRGSLSRTIAGFVSGAGGGRRRRTLSPHLALCAFRDQAATRRLSRVIGAPVRTGGAPCGPDIAYVLEMTPRGTRLHLLEADRRKVEGVLGKVSALLESLCVRIAAGEVAECTPRVPGLGRAQGEVPGGAASLREAPFAFGSHIGVPLVDEAGRVRGMMGCFSMEGSLFLDKDEHRLIRRLAREIHIAPAR